jgi:VIT1/CCC1 family predicted Fe2+/Mn2+ transporter
VDPVEIALWALQILLAIAFLLFGYVHWIRFEQTAAGPFTTWMSDVGRSRMSIIGGLEFAGAIGPVLPAVTGILPWLTALAAAMLALLMVFAIIFHAARREWPNIAGNAVLGLLAGFVAYGRFVVAPFA